VLLENRVAVIYGAGGAIGGAVARAFAHEGASVFLTGRKRETVDRVANEIRSAGGNAETAELDAQNEHAVESHLADVVGTTGSVDVSFNAVGSRRSKVSLWSTSPSQTSSSRSMAGREPSS
jgi:NADP-dependent 3-hydroxy acid dehydrogenase YdfG